MACEAAVLADINAARGSEGVAPMTLPSGYDALSAPQQLLVLANLERVARGLTPALGLSAGLDGIAAVGATADLDPNPSQINGEGFSANWAGGVPTPLFADFLWMYDDGPGSGNINCIYNDQSGCWVHRNNILYPFRAPLVMGAALNPSTLDGPSLAELFVGGDTATARGAADAVLAPTWYTIAQSLQVDPSPRSLVLSRGVRSGQLDITAPAASMHVDASITSGSGAWDVSPSSCELATGSSCTLTVTGPAGGTGILALSGPAGVQTVSLASQEPTSLQMRVSRTRSAAGPVTKVTGHLVDSAGSGLSGQLVTLYKRTGGSRRTSVVSSARTAAPGGSVSFTISPQPTTRTTRYGLSFAGSPMLAASSVGQAENHLSRRH